MNIRVIIVSMWLIEVRIWKWNNGYVQKIYKFLPISFIFFSLYISETQKYINIFVTFHIYIWEFCVCLFCGLSDEFSGDSEILWWVVLCDCCFGCLESERETFSALKFFFDTHWIATIVWRGMSECPSTFKMSLKNSKNFIKQNLT